MTNQEKEIFLEKILYKPILLDDGENKRLMVIYMADTNRSRILSADGEAIETLEYILYLVDVTTSLVAGHTVIDQYTIIDWDKVQQAIEVLDAEKYYPAFVAISKMFASEMSTAAKELENAALAANTIRHLFNPVIKIDKHEVVSAFVKDILQIDTSDFKVDELQNIGDLLLDIISEHLEINADDQDSVRKLQAEIDYKVTDILPERLRDIPLSINMPSVLKEINHLKEHIDLENEQEED